MEETVIITKEVYDKIVNFFIKKETNRLKITKIPKKPKKLMNQKKEKSLTMEINPKIRFWTVMIQEEK